MPNKKRRAKNAPELDFELPPATLAKTTNLSTTKSRLRTKRLRKPHLRTFENEDDTPKAFSRLMAFASGARKLPNGLDDGNTKSTSGGHPKKRKRIADAPAAAPPPQKDNIAEQLTIQPGESLREFNRRVDATLPVQIKLAREPRKPKKPKPEPAAPQREEEGDYSDGEGGEGKRRRGKNKGRAASPDPWAGLAARREAPRFGEVAGAPPTLKGVKEVLHRRGIVDVPKSAGSLARREGLEVERRGIVEGYRRMREERAGGD